MATGARIDAASRGWGWREQGATPDPFLRHVQSSEAGSSVTAETRAFGPGYRINIGGGHGARGDDRRGKSDHISEAYIKEYGNPYGYATAPFLPGSPNGTFNYTDVKRGGGVVWIACGRKIFLNGMIVADCDRAFYSGGSGGSVWLLGRSVDAGATAAITAIGGGVDDKQGYLAGGAGGRVAVVLGATDEEVSALARGERPEGLSYTNQIDFISVNVSGGPEGTQQGARPEPYAPTGTVMFVRGTLASKSVNVRANVQAGSPTPAYGQSSADVGDVLTFTATQDGYGTDPSDPQTSRWRCAGYVVSNATEEVARGSAATFDIEMPNEDLVVTWIWADKENRLSVGNPQGAAYGSVTVDGGTPSETGVTFWKGASATFTAYAVPADGCEFLYWAGDFPYGQAKTNPLTVAVAAKKHLWPVFRRSEAPTVRTFLVADGASAGFHDESAWSGGNFPGIEDEVVIASGRCSAWSNNYVEVKSLVVSNAATRFVLGVQKLTTAVSFGPAAARVNNDFPTACSTLAEEVALVVADDVTIACGAQLGVGSPYANRKAHGRLTAANVTLADDSQLMVVAGGVDEGTFTRANGAGLVTVAGTFDVRDTAVFRPASRPSDGGSVKTTARRFSLSAGATVSAWGMGYKSETSPGSGLTYTIGAGYGGCGGNHTVVYGNAYGQAAAPIHPGSSGGLWAGAQMDGGGLVRIHAKAMTIDGTVDVRPEQNWAADRWYSGGAGGGIWLSAATFAFGAEAKLLASGGPAADYPTGAGGGRIALVRSADDAELTALAETGAAPHLKIRDRAAFDAAYPDHTLTIDVHGGDRYTDTATTPAHTYVGPSGKDGTFAFVVPAPGLMVIIR